MLVRLLHILFILVVCNIDNAVHIAYDNTARNVGSIELVFFNHLKNWNSAADIPAVIINRTISQGFCLISTKAFKSGEIILSEVPVVSWCYDPRSTRCSQCHSLLTNVPVVCNRCQEMYCSLNCRQHANIYHKPLCALSKVADLSSSLPIHKQIENTAIKVYSKNREDGYICLIMRLYSLAYACELRNALAVPGVMVLESKASSSAGSKLSRFIHEVDQLFSERLGNVYRSNSNPRQQSSDNISVLYHLHYILQHYAILTYKGLNGLYLSAGFMNHHCSPNVEIVLDPDTFKPGNLMKVRAIKDVKANEELTISYVDPSDSYSERQSDLVKEYHFACECSRCVSENPNVPNSQIKSSKLRNLRHLRRKDT